MDLPMELARQSAEICMLVVLNLDCLMGMENTSGVLVVIGRVTYMLDILKMAKEFLVNIGGREELLKRAHFIKVN
ncbi:MAG: hypothetical protein CFE38_09015 [Comamonadaceae bacterium PBBC1]|nr:MAG: hypothetical protein CFE38_09015 [Comamonadaceae bacterium PBBC1]